MRKQFLSTTALVAVGAIAASPAMAQMAKKGPAVQLGVHGYMEQIIGVLFDKNDLAKTGNAAENTRVDQQTESEIHFRGSGKLDNGIEIVADVQFEVTGSPGNLVDEQYMIVRGSFGQLTLGSEDNAGHLMTIGYSGSWATGVGQSLTFDRTDWINLPANYTGGGSRFDGTLNDVRLRSGDNDSSKISYFTPRFAGFQVGISYIPNFQQQTSPAFGGGGQGPLPAQKSVYHNGWAFGANYTRKFGQVGLGIGTGYLTAESAGTNPADTAATWKNTDDMGAWSFATRVDFGPFRISGAVKKNWDVRANGGNSTTTSLDGTIFDIGGRFTLGANMMSIGYTHGEIDASRANTKKDEEDGLMISYARALGPGVKWTANLLYSNYDGEGTGVGTENDGWAATTTLRLAF